MNSSSTVRRFAAIALTLTAAFGLARAADAAPVTSGSAGGACKVTSGPNAGKTGTVTVEVDDQGVKHTWCEGSWGGTECTGSKCSTALKGRPNVFGGVRNTAVKSYSAASGSALKSALPR